jgi:hypothetical protein
MHLKNELLPDIEITDVDGQKHRLWDYRQKTHLVLLFGDGAAASAAGLTAKRKVLDWLGIRVIACGPPPAGFEVGATGVDRYGRFLDHWPFGDDLIDRIEKEFLYYEARHC